MSTTVIGSSPLSLPLTFGAPTIEVKAVWSDDWETRTDLEIIRWSFAVSEAGICSAEFRSRYNDTICLPGASSFASADPLDLRDYWVHITLPSDSGAVEVFKGLVYNDVRDIRGTASRMMGHQPWVAYGPKKILQMMDISTSYWLDGGDEKQMAWLPPMNARDKRKILVGNRSEDTNDDDVYLYGGTDIWTHGQYLAMLVDKFIQQVGGPTWTIGGQSDVLELLSTNIHFGHVANVADICKKLISREYGLDYCINYTDDGFEIFIFSLLGDDSTFESATLPANPNLVEIERGDQIDLIDVRVVRSRNNMVDRFRVIGRRVIVCATLGGITASAGNSDLLPQWVDSLVTDYKAGRGSGDFDADEHDQARKSDKFRSVYQQYGPPADWDWNGGLYSPLIQLDGTIGEDPADVQNSVRSTLEYLPLKENYDYTVDPATGDNSVDGIEPELLPPLAWVYDSDAGLYVQCEHNGMSVHGPHNELGIYINASPNHLLALNHAFGEGSDEYNTTAHDPEYDYDSLVATIAFETGQRVQYGFDVEDDLMVGDGSCKTIYVDDAEMWLLAPNTVVGLNADGTFNLSPDDMVVLRDDTPRLTLICAGAIARYTDERVRADITIKGHMPWVSFAGQILEMVEELDEDSPVGTPITLIEWTMGSSPQMTMKAGYA